MAVLALGCSADLGDGSGGGDVGSDEVFPATGCRPTSISPTEVVVDCGPTLPILRLAGQVFGDDCDVAELSVGVWEVVCDGESVTLPEANPIELLALHGDKDGTTANLEYVRFSQSGALEVVPLSNIEPGWRIDEVAVNPGKDKFVFQAIDQDPKVEFCCSDCEVPERDPPRLRAAILDREAFTATLHDVPVELDANVDDVGRLWGFDHGLGAGRTKFEDIYAQTAEGFFTFEVTSDGVGPPVKRVGREIDPFEYENHNSAGAFVYLWKTTIGPYLIEYRPKDKQDGVWVSATNIERTRVADCVDCGVYVFGGNNAMMAATTIYSVDIATLQPSKVTMVEMSRLPNFSAVELPREDYVMVQPLRADNEFSYYYGAHPGTPWTCQ